MWLAVDRTSSRVYLAQTKLERVLRSPIEDACRLCFSRMSDSGIQQEIEPELTVRPKSLTTKSWFNFFEAEFHFARKRLCVRSGSFAAVEIIFVTRYISVSFLQVQAVKRTAKTRKGRPRKALKQVWLTFLMCSQCVFCFVVEETAYSSVLLINGCDRVALTRLSRVF